MKESGSEDPQVKEQERGEGEVEIFSQAHLVSDWVLHCWTAED